MTLYRRTAGVYTALNFSAVLRREAGVYVVAKEALVRGSGAYANSWRADGPPPAPISLTSVAANGGTVTVGWAYAANVEADYNRVEVQAPGDTARNATNYAGLSQVRTGYAHGVSVPLEARTVDNGGQVSAWTAVPTVSAISALPGAASISNFAWERTNQRFIIQWTDPGNPYGDISAVRVYYRNSGEGTWTLHSEYGTAGGLRTVYMAGRGWDVLAQAFVRVINNAGYADSAVVTAWTPPQPGTEKIINCVLGDSWGFTAGAYREDGTVRMGMFSTTPWGNHYGMYFYGTNGLWNLGHGWPAFSGEIFMVRSGVEGFTGTVFFYPHGYNTKPATTPGGNGLTWASTSQFGGADASGWESIPVDVLSSIADGGTRGIGIYTPELLQSYYKVFKGPALNGLAGQIKLRY